MTPPLVREQSKASPGLGFGKAERVPSPAHAELRRGDGNDQPLCTWKVVVHCGRALAA